MKRSIVTIVGTVAGLALLLGFKTQPATTPLASAITPSATSNGSSTGSGSGSAASNGGSNGSNGGSSSSSGSTATASRTITGSSAGTPYGPVQIQVTTSGNQITDVKILQAPWSNGQDQQINSYALPILIRETLSAQSATIDMVSGATYTSGGYITSLQSVMDQLHA